MVKRIRYYVIYGLLIIAAGMAFLQLSGQQLHELPASTDNEPDAYGSGMQTKQFDKTGRLQHHFTASGLRYFDKAERGEAKNPNITAITSQGYPVKLSARHGQLLGHDKLALTGNVRIHYEHQQQLPLLLKTPYLEYNTTTEIATTDAPVDMSQNRVFQLSAIGMTANLKTNKVILHQQVRGKYDPAR